MPGYFRGGPMPDDSCNLDYYITATGTPRIAKTNPQDPDIPRRGQFAHPEADAGNAIQQDLEAPEAESSDSDGLGPLAPGAAPVGAEEPNPDAQVVAAMASTM